VAVARNLADIVGIDYYPCHALVGLGSRSVYLDGRRGLWHWWRRARLFARLRVARKRMMVTEGQAEPWEAITTPPNPVGWTMYSCAPEQVIRNYNRWMQWAREAVFPLEAYLFWGAEYWVLREQCGDPRYIQAFARILAHGA
jgi:hypothetical protein